MGKTSIPRQNLRRRTGTAPVSDLGAIAPARPEGFSEWWRFGIEQADAAVEEPRRLHNENRPLADHDRNQPIIMGWPFSVPFERYLDSEWGKSPFRSAMANFYRASRGRPEAVQRDEYKILFAMLGGHTDSETVRALIGGPHVAYFEERAICALAEVWGRGALMVALAIETDGLPLELLEPPVRKKFSLLCDGQCQNPNCQAKKTLDGV